MASKKRLVILGSTGSVGKNCLEVVARCPERFEVTGLVAHQDGVRLERQIRRFRPQVVALTNPAAARELRRRCRDLPVKVLEGLDGVTEVAVHPAADLVVSAIVGAAGLIPTIAAIRAGRPVAIANKETLVMAGSIVTREAKAHGVPLLPIDSEHSAVFQCLEGHKAADICRILLTASGGPFLGVPRRRLQRVRPDQALRHPTWRMGKKITIDSATLMNKGLEVIEARWLFDVSPDQIEVVIHPQSIIHSLVEFRDGSVLAQLGRPDMRLPIAYALGYPERVRLGLAPLDLAKIGTLTFQRPNRRAFPCLGLAYDAVRTGGTMPAVLNAANEEAVGAYLAEQISFLAIPKIIERTMTAHTPWETKEIADVVAADAWSREIARGMIKAMARRGRG